MTPATQARLLKGLRQMLRFDLAEVAEALGVEVATLESFEQGDGYALNRKQLRRLCWSYGQEYHLLLAGRVQKEAINREGLRLQHNNPRDWLSLSIWFRTADYFAVNLRHVVPSPIRLPFSSSEETLYHPAFYKPLVLLQETVGIGTDMELPPLAYDDIVKQGKRMHLPRLAYEEIIKQGKRGLLNRVELEDLLVI